MSHPFDLNPVDLEHLDLDFEESLSDGEAEQVGGGLSIYTTEKYGEEGGDAPIPYPYPKPWPPIVCVTEPCEYPLLYPPQPIKPPIFTTMALGEEGGDIW